MLGGVAGGVASYLQIDSTLARLAFAALFLAAGAGLLLYVIAWIVIPEDPLLAPVPGAVPPTQGGATGAGAALTPPPAPPSRAQGWSARGARLVVGAVLVAVGCILLLGWTVPDLHRFFWPGAIVVLGLGLLAYGARR